MFDEFIRLSDLTETLANSLRYFAINIHLFMGFILEFYGGLLTTSSSSSTRYSDLFKWFPCCCYSPLELSTYLCEVSQWHCLATLLIHYECASRGLWNFANVCRQLYSPPSPFISTQCHAAHSQRNTSQTSINTHYSIII